MRSLVCAADRDGAGAGEGPALPGTRFAIGTRLGRPARVVPEDTGARATPAARHPSSAGEDQPAGLGAWLDAGPGQSAPIRPRRNQSDSTDSKIGSLFSSPMPGAGGTITPGASLLPGAVPFGRGTPLLGSIPSPGAAPPPFGMPVAGDAVAAPEYEGELAAAPRSPGRDYVLCY